MSRRRRSGGIGAAAALLSLLLAAGGYWANERGLLDLPDAVQQDEPASLSAAEAQAALTVLAQLPVKQDAGRNGYERELFGQRWADVDHNGCDTRNDILARDLTQVQHKPGTRQCVVTAGVLADPYTGRTITFSKTDAAAVQIDHVVSLSNAWRTGAQSLSPEARAALANDPTNLLAVDGPTNQDKGDKDAAQWQPPRVAARCALAARQVDVKRKYGLWVDPPERDALERELKRCATPR